MSCVSKWQIFMASVNYILRMAGVMGSGFLGLGEPARYQAYRNVFEAGLNLAAMPDDHDDEYRDRVRAYIDSDEVIPDAPSARAFLEMVNDFLVDPKLSRNSAQYLFSLLRNRRARLEEMIPAEMQAAREKFVQAQAEGIERPEHLVGNALFGGEDLSVLAWAAKDPNWFRKRRERAVQSAVPASKRSTDPNESNRAFIQERMAGQILGQIYPVQGDGDSRKIQSWGARGSEPNQRYEFTIGSGGNVIANEIRAITPNRTLSHKYAIGVPEDQRDQVESLASVYQESYTLEDVTNRPITDDLHLSRLNLNLARYCPSAVASRGTITQVRYTRRSADTRILKSAAVGSIGTTYRVEIPGLYPMHVTFKNTYPYGFGADEIRNPRDILDREPQKDDPLEITVTFLEGPNKGKTDTVGRALRQAAIEE